jgi:hypothetical protein
MYDFKIQGVKKLIERSRERIESGGIPHNLNDNELSDLERIIILNQEALQYRSFSLDKGDGVSYLKNLFSGQTKNLNSVDISTRLKKIISNRFQERMTS